MCWDECILVVVGGMNVDDILRAMEESNWSLLYLCGKTRNRESSSRKVCMIISLLLCKISVCMYTALIIFIPYDNNDIDKSVT